MSFMKKFFIGINFIYQIDSLSPSMSDNDHPLKNYKRCLTNRIHSYQERRKQIVCRWSLFSPEKKYIF